jgi:hypothetical protein
MTSTSKYIANIISSDEKPNNFSLRLETKWGCSALTYHTQNQSKGLSFSRQEGNRISQEMQQERNKSHPRWKREKQTATFHKWQDWLLSRIDQPQQDFFAEMRKLSLKFVWKLQELQKQNNFEKGEYWKKV